MMDKCSIQKHSAFTGKERELGWIANPAQRHDTEHPQSQPYVAVSNIRHDGAENATNHPPPTENTAPQAFPTQAQ